MTTNTQQLINRSKGALLGLAIGDALGTTLEFKRRGTYPPLEDMIGGGRFNLSPGQWTDDTSMALCLSESLIELGVFDAKDQVQRYLKWWKEGYLSSTGHCFDIGMTVWSAINNFVSSGNPYAGSTSPDSAGNGSLMRIAPIPIRFRTNIPEAIEYAEKSSKTTHGAQESIDACKIATLLIANLLNGMTKYDALKDCSLWARNNLSLSPKLNQVLNGSYMIDDESKIKGSSYVVESLEASLWAFYKGNSYKETVLLAANLGDDADTTAAIAGQFAGALYGESGIPTQWLNLLHLKEYISDSAVALTLASS